MRTLMAAAAAAAAALAGSAAAGVAQLKSEADVAAWERRALKVDGWSRLVWADDGAFYMRKESWQRGSAGTVRLWIRHESLAPDEDGFLSSNTLWEFDCEGRRTRFLAADAYGERNLGGPEKSLDVADAEWTFDRPQTIGESISDTVCTIVEQVMATPATKWRDADN
ncbi:MAG: hypothetical protein KY449_11845 [Proteobacteria bacterium]|nr:hypothetical protein [Pseudomonadota bacterium]